MNKLLTLLLTLFLAYSCSIPKTGKTADPGDYRVAFYNVENLFDTDDDPTNAGDDEYLPGSKKNWTPARYQMKLDHLARVVEGMGYPALIGLAEVENARVLEDFCNKTSLKAHNYGYVHFESPDFRGIDVAFLYKKNVFKVTSSDTVRIKFPVGMIPEYPNYTTRDLLLVEGKFNGKEKLYIIVAHLPSRSGGQKETEPRRRHVASQIGGEIAAIFKSDGNANIIVMGDMNDEPTDPSMAQNIGAQSFDGNFSNTTMYNCFSELKEKGLGSYRYKGDWNMLDQVILSTNLAKGNKKLHYARSGIFQQEWMMYKDEKYGLSPSRTYGGDRFFGGYSDHLPVWVELK
ncbi:MAG: endonuclease [Saprospiraceae bacterium]|nr:endonuclease [Saprospiraceae bacterium]MCF8248536.1 endonuclease [Saprospiraceae bacterium]MCF8310270.1 endonuclease [Saprospiraceae bacterium]MCF8439291.1 endonuclease [Saprospiraceae bacterium]